MSLVFPLIFLSGAGFAGTGLASRFVYGAIGVCGLVVPYRILRSGIFVDENGLRVRNILRGTQIPWANIKYFARPDPCGDIFRTGLQIRCIENEIHYAGLYSPGPYNRESFADDVIRQLSQLQVEAMATHHVCAANGQMFRYLPFPFERDTFHASLGAVVQLTILEGIEPAREVVHADGGSWLIGDGVNDPNPAGKSIATHIWHAIQHDSSIAALATLPRGHIATRSEPDDPWSVTPHHWED